MRVDIYLRAVNRRIDTFYEIIPRRAEWMIDRLRKVIIEELSELKKVHKMTVIMQNVDNLYK